MEKETLQEKILYESTPANTLGKLRWIWFFLFILTTHLILIELTNGLDPFIDLITYFKRPYISFILTLLLVAFWILERRSSLSNKSITFYHQFFSFKFLEFKYDLKNFEFYAISKTANTTTIVLIPYKKFSRNISYKIINQDGDIEPVLFFKNEYFLKNSFSLKGKKKQKEIVQDISLSSVFPSLKLEFEKSNELGKFIHRDQHLSVNLQSDDVEITVNSQKISPEKEYLLRAGDVVSCLSENVEIIKEKKIIPPQKINATKLFLKIIFSPKSIPIIGLIIAILYPYKIKNCDDNNYEQCFISGKHFIQYGNFSKGIPLLKKSCKEATDDYIMKESCLLLGRAYKFGNHKEDKYLKYLDQSLQLEHPFAHVLIGREALAFEKTLKNIYKLEMECLNKKWNMCLYLAESFAIISNYPKVSKTLKFVTDNTPGTYYYQILTSPFLTNFLKSKEGLDFLKLIEKKENKYTFDHFKQKDKSYYNFIKARYFHQFNYARIKEICRNQTNTYCYLKAKNHFKKYFPEIDLKDSIDISNYLYSVFEWPYTNKSGVITRSEKIANRIDFNIFLIKELYKKNFTSPMDALGLYYLQYVLKKQTANLFNEFNKILIEADQSESKILSEKNHLLKEIESNVKSKKEDFDQISAIKIQEIITYKTKNFPFLVFIYSKLIKLVHSS